MCFSAWSSAKQAFIDGPRHFCVLDQLTPFDREKKIEVGFVNMDDSESIDFVVACLFEDHRIDDSLPTMKRVTGVEAKVQNCENGPSNKVLFISKGKLSWKYWFCVR